MNQLLIPCWNTESLRVLQMMRSAHWTTTMETKKAVWQVYSRTLRSLKKNIKYQLVVDNRLVYVLRYYNFGRYFGFDITIFWNEN